MISSKFRAVAVAACLGVAAAGGHAAETERTRAEAIAEVHAARAQGKLGITHGEDSGAFHLSHAAPTERVGALLARR